MRILIQMRSTPELSAATTSARSLATAPSLALLGFTLDQSYAPVKVPDKQPREHVGEREVGQLFTFDARPEVSTYLVRGEVADEAVLVELTAAVEHPNAVGVFSDPRISAIAVCPSAPVGNHRDVENLLGTPQLHASNMNGSKVMVAIVDTGVNLQHLKNKGKNPNFDAANSWTPVQNLTPGTMPVAHGTMCAFDVCITAPNCTLLDYALLLSQAQGGTGWVFE